jgi:hypothetical protein
MRTPLLLLLFVPVVAGCNGASLLGGSSDAAAAADLSLADLAGTDFVAVDLAAPVGSSDSAAAADLSLADLAGADFAAVDLAAPNSGNPDLIGIDMAGCPAVKPTSFTSCTNSPGTVTGPTCVYLTGACTCSDAVWTC